MTKIEEEGGRKIKDYDLRQRGLDPARVRRWFKKNRGMTFQNYLRSMRINHVFGQIREGDQVIQSAFSSGYDSFSGFLDSFKKTTKQRPISHQSDQSLHAAWVDDSRSYRRWNLFTRVYRSTHDRNTI